MSGTGSGVSAATSYCDIWRRKECPVLWGVRDSTSLGAAPSRLKLNYLKILKQTLWRIFFGNSIYCVYIPILQCISCFNIKISKMVCEVRVSGRDTLHCGEFVFFLKTLQIFLLIASEIITTLHVKTIFGLIYRDVTKRNLRI